MTRFARATGSKGSNKRLREDPTPWTDLKLKPVTCDKDNEEACNKKTKRRKVDHNEQQNPPQKEIVVERKMKYNEEKDASHKEIGQKVKHNDKTKVDKKLGFITENGQRYKVFKSGVKKPWIDIPYEENDVMTLYNKFFVKKEAVEELDKFKKSLEGLTEKEINNKMMTRERRAHTKLRVQLMWSQINAMKEANNNNNGTGEEVNSTMPKCNANRKTKPDYQNKKKRNTKNNKRVSCNSDGSFIDTDTGFKGRPKLVKYDGFSVTEEAAERLHYMKDELSNKNFSQKEISQAIKLERRKDERGLKKIRKLICFNCREPGHTVAQCQLSKTAEICFKCGSTEHMARNCLKQGSYELAQCFHCNKTGHLARECPDNPNGIYPNGGCCRECNSVNHLARDCPTLMEKNEDCITLKTMTSGGNPEEMDF